MLASEFFRKPFGGFSDDSNAAKDGVLLLNVLREIVSVNALPVLIDKSNSIRNIQQGS